MGHCERSERVGLCAELRVPADAPFSPKQHGDGRRSWRGHGNSFWVSTLLAGIRYTHWGARHFVSPVGGLSSIPNQVELLLGISFSRSKSK